MAHQTPTAEKAQEQVRRRSEWNVPEIETGQVTNATVRLGVGGNDLSTQVAVLQRLGGAQRVALMRNIGRVQGNQHAQHLVMACRQSPVGQGRGGLTVQARMSVSEPGDVYEQEADQVAERVMRMSGPAMPPDDEQASLPTVHRAPVIPGAGTESGSGLEAAPEVEGRIERMRGGGQPLPETERAFFEPRLGVDLSGVRVHTDGEAVQTARELSARAYTVGSDIAFNAGEYEPGTDRGRRLLAHELAHVVQQGGAGTLRRRPKTNRRVSEQCAEDQVHRKPFVQRLAVRLGGLSSEPVNWFIAPDHQADQVAHKTRPQHWADLPNWMSGVPQAIFDTNKKDGNGKFRERPSDIQRPAPDLADQANILHSIKAESAWMIESETQTHSKALPQPVQPDQLSFQSDKSNGQAGKWSKPLKRLTNKSPFGSARLLETPISQTLPGIRAPKQPVEGESSVLSQAPSGLKDLIPTAPIEAVGQTLPAVNVRQPDFDNMPLDAAWQEAMAQIDEVRSSSVIPTLPQMLPIPSLPEVATTVQQPDLEDISLETARQKLTAKIQAQDLIAPAWSQTQSKAVSSALKASATEKLTERFVPPVNSELNKLPDLVQPPAPLAESIQGVQKQLSEQTEPSELPIRTNEIPTSELTRQEEQNPVSTPEPNILSAASQPVRHSFPTLERLKGAVVSHFPQGIMGFKPENKSILIQRTPLPNVQRSLLNKLVPDWVESFLSGLSGEAESKKGELQEEGGNKRGEVGNTSATKAHELEADGQNKQQELKNDQDTKSTELKGHQETKSAELQADQETKNAELEADRQSKSVELEADRQSKSAELEADQRSKSAELEVDRQSKGVELETDVQAKEAELQLETENQGQQIESSWQATQEEAEQVQTQAMQQVESEGSALETEAASAKTQVEGGWKNLQAGAEGTMQALKSRADELVKSYEGQVQNLVSQLVPTRRESVQELEQLQAQASVAWQSFNQDAQIQATGIEQRVAQYGQGVTDKIQKPLEAKSQSLGEKATQLTTGVQTWMQERWNKLLQQWTSIEDGIKQQAAEARAWIGERADAAREFIHGKANAAREFIYGKADAAREFIHSRADAAREFINQKAEAARQFIGDKADAAREFIRGKADAARAWIGDKAAGARTWIEGRSVAAQTWIGDRAQSANTWIADKTQAAQQWIKGKAGAAVNWFRNQGQTFVSGMANKARQVANGIGSKGGKIMKWFANAVNSLISGVESVGNTVVSTVSQAMSAGLNLIESKASGVIGWVGNAATGAVNFVGNAATGAVNFVGNAATGAVNFVQNTATSVVNRVEHTAGGAITFVENAATGAVNLTQNVSTTAVSGIENMTTGVVSLTEQAATGAVGIVENVATGVVNGMETIAQGAVTRLEQSALSTVQFARGIWNGIQSAWQAVQAGFRQVMNGLSVLATQIGNAVGQFFAQVSVWIQSGVTSIKIILQKLPSALSQGWTSFQQKLNDLWSSVKQNVPAIANVVNVIGEIVEGSVLGDFVDDPNGWNILGQVLVGFTPIGWIGDARDLIAAGIKLAKGEGSWWDLGMAIIGFIPGVGDAAKGLGKGLKALTTLASNLGEGVKLLGKVNNLGDAIHALKKMGNVDEIIGVVKGMRGDIQDFTHMVAGVSRMVIKDPKAVLNVIREGGRKGIGDIVDMLRKGKDALKSLTVDKPFKWLSNQVRSGFMEGWKGMEGVGPSGKVWNDPSMTPREFISDYRHFKPSKTLSDEELIEEFNKGRRINPATRRLKKAHLPLYVPYEQLKALVREVEKGAIEEISLLLLGEVDDWINEIHTDMHPISTPSPPTPTPTPTSTPTPTWKPTPTLIPISATKDVLNPDLDDDAASSRVSASQR